jgi:hypothetical protein
VLLTATREADQFRKYAYTRTKQKGKAIPVTGRGGLYGSEMLRIPHCLDHRLVDGGKVVSPTITILDIFHRRAFYLKLR